MRLPPSSNVEELKHEVHAWALNPSTIPPERLRSRCFDWMSTDERQEWETRATSALRHDYLAAHALCRCALSRYLPVNPADWQFDRGIHGKPYIAAPAIGRMLSFNLTHTHDLAICVVHSGRDIGVDVEEIRPNCDIDAISQHFLSADDRHHLMRFGGPDRIDRFFETWVLKECYLKGCGSGLARDPGEFTIPIPIDGKNRTRFAGWQFSIHRPSPNHIAAIAVACDDQELPIRWQWAELPLETSSRYNTTVHLFPVPPL